LTPVFIFGALFAFTMRAGAAPTVTITAPQSGATSNAATTINGSCTDGLTVKLFINGSTTPAGTVTCAGSAFTINATLNQATNSLVARAYDSFGNQVGPDSTVTDVSVSGSVGLTATKPAAPPTVGATISVPTNGATLTTSPFEVTGICSGDVLVKLFKNNVFAGSAICSGGSFSITTDLFSGTNEFVARVFDNLDQEGPVSNTVSVTYANNTATPDIANRIQLTSNYAKRGANPNETLIWPIIISGGTGPYAISVDWGDTKTTLYSTANAGQFNIEHQYQNSGIYKVTITAVDANNVTAFLQVVAVANGPLSQTSTNDAQAQQKETVTKVLWQPTVAVIPFVVITFWVGKLYEVKRIKKAIEAGRHPF
jgi:hypothetical protein